ncbi:MAG TPA: ABC transporter permease [Chthoniobacterales bacterium]
MKIPFTLFLALRYLRPKRTFLSIITIICIVGVMLGVAVPILVISVMTGFEQELRKKVLGFDAHLTVSAPRNVVQDWRAVAAKTGEVPGVVAVAPYVQGRVLAKFNHLVMAPYIRGINPVLEEKVSSIKNYIVEGSYDLSGDNAIIGSDLADQLGIGVGDTLSLTATKNIDAIIAHLDAVGEGPVDAKQVADIKEMIIPIDVTISGIFKSGRYAYDSDYILVPLNIGQELYSLGDSVHGLIVRTVDANRSDEFRDAINAKLHESDGLVATTWMEQNSQIFEAIIMERNVMFFLLLFIVIVAAFGIMSTLITTTVQKTREIGVIKALGARMSQILWVFLAQGMVVGFIGTLSGLGMGMIVLQYRNDFRRWLSERLHIEVFPAGVYQFAEIPAMIVPRDVAIICVSGFIICTIAALIPALFAARLDPVKALRYD